MIQANSTLRSSCRSGTKLLWTTAAAAAVTLSCTTPNPVASAFVAVQPEPRRGQLLQHAPATFAFHNHAPAHRHRIVPQRRPLSSQRGSRRGGDDGGGGFLEKVGNAVKSILPSSWFQTEQEKRAALERKRVQDEISGGLSDLLRDAPLPIRMIGGLVKPMISTVMSGLAETIAEQQETVSSLLSAAQRCLEEDDRVSQVLQGGGSLPLRVSPPFSQSSSTSSINGQTMSRVELAFEVSGPVQSGVVRLSASNGKITRLTLQAADGRVLEVSTVPSKRRSRISGNKDDDSTIIEAEIIEKKPRP